MTDKWDETASLLMKDISPEFGYKGCVIKNRSYELMHLGLYRQSRKKKKNHTHIILNCIMTMFASLVFHWSYLDNVAKR